jgi:hypothetical protein
MPVVEDHAVFEANARKAHSRVSFPKRLVVPDVHAALTRWLSAYRISAEPYATLGASYWKDFSRFCDGITKKLGLAAYDVSQDDLPPENAVIVMVVVMQYYFG